jgi:hypothetical protein
VERRGGRRRVELAIALHRLAGRQRLDRDPAALERLDHGGVGDEAAVGSAAEDQALGQILEHLFEILDRQRVPLAPPPLRNDAVRKQDQVPPVLGAVDDYAPEAVVGYLRDLLILTSRPPPAPV